MSEPTGQGGAPRVRRSQERGVFLQRGGRPRKPLLSEVGKILLNAVRGADQATPNFFDRHTEGCGSQ
ncbi:MAG: hypothetical protein MPJ22_13335, partial [Pirellulales bacterium]|nr:hypothetical protein [Pirellulales bacterium]